MIQKLLCLTGFSEEFFTGSQCAFPENIHTPPTEGIGIPWGKVIVEDMEHKINKIRHVFSESIKFINLHTKENATIQMTSV